ncbi:Vps51/Vps67-domain-containing protein [Lipomyces oligophaga]|uniref:Vps51/Vps67-domain-containing protein n=1 Tax=Lipomyces oligophaga TaxID=45792 RepID=UPI0034CED076
MAASSRATPRVSTESNVSSSAGGGYLRGGVDTQSSSRSVSRTGGSSTPSSASAARRTALREFYAIGNDRFSAAVAPSDIDRPDFKPDEWLDNFVRTHGSHDLLSKTNNLAHEIVTLEGEGKALVYDNYSKLISATETIQSMRGSMDPLQPTTSALAPAVAHIADVSASLNAMLTRTADQKSKAIKDTLLELIHAPEKLKALIDAGNREEAEHEWNSWIAPSLDKLHENHIKGADEIRQKCLALL